LIRSLCLRCGITYQAYYKKAGTIKNQNLKEQMVFSAIENIRKIQPQLGGKKLHRLLQEQDMFTEGRDKLFVFLKEKGLLIKRKKRFVSTTNSRHRFFVYDNIIKDIKPERSNHVWVSDITYLNTLEGFCYLSLITDAYSRKIVGYHVSDTLELEGSLKALKMACAALKQPTKDLIHHSDRGIQYCSKPYTAWLKKRNIKISMAAKGNCYENALAERINGILKTEYYLGERFKSKQIAYQATKQAVWIYNNLRPHWALNLKRPAEVHLN
jgi:putative transposase